MPVFYMETDTVRAMANQIKQIAEEIRIQAQFLNSATQNIDWEGFSRNEFVSMAELLINRIQIQVEAGNNLSIRVENEIVEWETIAESLSSTSNGNASTPESSITGYLHPENQNKISEERIQDVTNILGETEYGRKLLEYLRENNIEIVFGELANEQGGFCEKLVNGKTRITINTQNASDNDYELAAVVLHEAVHAKNYPNNIMDEVNPWKKAENEYTAYQAQAEFWKSVKENNKLPDNKNQDELVNGIYDKSGNIIDKDTVVKQIFDADVKNRLDKSWDQIFPFWKNKEEKNE